MYISFLHLLKQPSNQEQWIPPSKEAALVLYNLAFTAKLLSEAEWPVTEVKSDNLKV